MDSREIWEKLIKVAISDGVLSEDEHKLLQVIFESMEIYTLLLDKAMEDGIIDYSEKIRLMNIRIKLLSRLNDIAKADKVITHEESELIFTIHDILNKLENFANDFVDYKL